MRMSQLSFWILFCIVVFLLPTGLTAQIEAVPEFTNAIRPPDISGDRECVDATIEIPFDVYRPDCADIYSSENIFFKYKLKDCFSFLSWCGFDRVEFIINDKVVGVDHIEDVDFIGNSTNWNINSINMNNIFPPIEINEMVDSPELCFEIKVFQRCLGTSSVVFQNKVCVPVVNEGEEYWLKELSDEIKFVEMECIDNPFVMVCCRHDGSKIFTSSYHASVSSSSTADFTFGFSNVELEAGPVNLSPVSYSTSYENIELFSEGISAESLIEVTKIDGACNSLRPIINLREIANNKYRAGSCEEEDLLLVSEVLGEMVWSVDLEYCEILSCTDERPEIIFEKFLASTRSQEDCVGNIEATIPEVYDGLMMFEWTGPNDFHSNNQNLENVPFGEYFLTVSDDCCNEYEYSYFLCDDVVRGEWIFDMDGFNYCRSLRCMSEGCDVEIGEECVVPDDVQTTVENENCIERHYYKSELLGEYTTSMEVRYEYDDFLEKCKKIVYCNDEIFNEETENPMFGDWIYNEFVGDCTRSILCFDQPGLVNDEAVVAQIDEFYNEVFEQCELHVTCDNEEVLNEITFADYSNWRINDFNNFCEADVACNGSEIFGIVHSELPSSTYEWNHNLSNPFGEECYRDVICNGELVVQYAPAIITSKPCYCDPMDVEGGVIPYEVIICPDDTVFEEECPPYDNCLGTFKEDNETEVRELSLDIGVYPNPANDLLFINGVQYNSAFNYKIFSIDGRMLLNDKITNSSIDISSLNSGVLYIEIYNNRNKKIFNQKIIRI